jgi:metallophosphoesterase (TIGR00282 family)
MNILFIGDIVGQPGRYVLKNVLAALKSEKKKFDFIIANAENAAGGKGLTKDVAEEIFSSGVNVITLGNHTWARKEIEQIIDDERVLRPANYPPGVPGRGWDVYSLSEHVKIAVLSLMGRVYMPLLDCPFRKADEILETADLDTKIIIVDFHAEITSEKQAFGWHLNGKVSAVIGTHTHVQTADGRMLPDGTAYITDCGMCGPRNGIIGVDRDIILKRYLTGLPHRFDVAGGDSVFNACAIEIDENTGKAKNIETIFKIVDGNNKNAHQD